jgi:general stress protein 26
MLQLKIDDSVDGEKCIEALQMGLTFLSDKLGPISEALLHEVTVEVGPGLTESGGQTFPADRHIVLDAEKSAMSLRSVEDLLVRKGDYQTDDLTPLLPVGASQPWSYTAYNIVHELGHLLKGEVAPELSPTKYGREKEGEVVAELFSYYVFNGRLSTQALAAIERILRDNSLLEGGEPLGNGREQKITRARELLTTVRHAAMATVNEDGSPHNTPYFFMCSPDLQYLYWGSHPESEHSKNVARTGQIFVVLYDAMERGGLFIQANNVHIAEGAELEQVHNDRRIAEGREPLPISYYQGDSPQRTYIAQTQKFWANTSERGAEGLIIRDIRIEITREDLLKGK